MLRSHKNVFSRLSTTNYLDGKNHILLMIHVESLFNGNYGVVFIKFLRIVELLFWRSRKSREISIVYNSANSQSTLGHFSGFLQNS